ncbi:MAG: ketopantoate reductase family protein [Rhodothermales bacterium]
MHYGIIGLGPVGATFACLLSAGGHKVSSLDNNLHRTEVLRNNPLKVTGHYQGEVELDHVFSSFNDFSASDPDVILISIKTYGLQDILERIRTYPNLCTKPVVSCQNGIDTEKEIAEALGEEYAYRMVLNFGVSYAGKSEVSINFLNEPHYLSSVSPSKADVARSIVEELNAVGMGVKYVEDIRKESFRKAILNCTLSSICTLTRMTMAEVMENPELFRMVKELLRENIWICKVLEIDLGEHFMEEAIAYLKKGGHHKPSMLIDIEQERVTEIRHLAGKLFEYAEKKGLPVPVTQTMYYLVKSLENSVMLHKYVQNPSV